MQVDNMERLDIGQRREVGKLVAAASQVDGVAPLSEHVLLAIAGDLDTGTDTAAGTGSPHFLAYDGAHLAGYAHLERGDAGSAATAELVVHPAWRRKGVGRALVRVLETALEPAPGTRPGTVLGTALGSGSGTAAEPGAAALRLWSHGHLDGARAFAARDGYSSVRELWAMRRSLGSDAEALPDISLPEGFRARHFSIGQDEDAWLRVNARAFTDHPEQGRLTRHDLDRRIAEPWFDARGFILIEDARGFTPVLAASHWTKVVAARHSEAGSRVGPETGSEEGSETGSETGSEISQKQGEVYVVGVDPDYQGLGLGRAVTVLGLAYLRELGLTEAMLYVDADNSAAVATYSRLGFVRFAADVIFARRAPAGVKIEP